MEGRWSARRIGNSAVARMIDAGERFEARVARLTPPLDVRMVVDWVLRGWRQPFYF